MASFRVSEDDFVFVKYRGFALWHQRLVLRDLGDNTFAVATPDWDVYAEQLDLRNDWLDGIHHCGRARAVPEGLSATYTFDSVRAPAVAAAKITAAEFAVVVPTGGAPPILPLLPPPPPGRRWRVVETFGDLLAGTLHVPTNTATLGLQRGFDQVRGREVSLAVSEADESGEKFLDRLGLAVGAAPSDDARVLAVFTRADGRRERTWQQITDLVSETELENFGVSGPRTVAWVVSFLARQQKHPEDYHAGWRQRHGLVPGDYGVGIHATAMRCLAAAACQDQLDLPNLCFAELLAREAQMIEHHYRNEEKAREEKKRKEKGGKGGVGMPTDEAELFLGAGKNFTEVMLCPTLSEFVSKQLERDAAIMKQSRKAREERALAK